MQFDERSVRGELQRQRAKRRATRVLHCPVILEVYDRGPGDKPEVVDEVLFDEILLDPREGSRRVRSQLENKDAFDLAARLANRKPITLTVHRGQVDPLLNREHKILAVLSGSRAGKTDWECRWLIIQWLLHGYDGATFGFLCPTRDQTRIVVEKLCIGRDAILPKELVIKWPKTGQTPDQHIYLIDGSKIRLFHGTGDGDNIRGYRIEAFAIDEITAIHKIENYRIAVNRTLDSGGQVAVGSTPKQNHWAKPEIIDKESESPDEIKNYKFTCFDNPWIATKEIDRLIKSMGGPDDPVCRREVFGEWVTDGNMAFPAWDPPRHMRDGDGRHVADYGLMDVTWQACTGFWRRWDGKSGYVGGQDFNINPMTVVVGQAFGDPNDQSTWGLFVLDEMQTKGRVEEHATALADRYPGIPLSCDPTGARPGTHASQGEYSRGANTNVKIMRTYGFDAKACAYKDGKAANIRQVDSINLVNWLLKRDRLVVHKRCTHLRRALQELETTDDGRIAKVSAVSSITDQLSAPVDALRYLCWSLFGKQWLRIFKREKAGEWPLAEG